MLRTSIPCGIPVRELSVRGPLIPLLLFERIRRWFDAGTTIRDAGGNVSARASVSELFKRITVHRGMYHSIPAMLIAASRVLDAPADHGVVADEMQARCYLAVGK